MEQSFDQEPGWAGWRSQQERMRYEVLRMLYRDSRCVEGCEVDARGFAYRLGVEEDDVWNALVWLEHGDFVQIHDAIGPVISISRGGIVYIEEEARRRRTIRGVAPPGKPEG